jgi:hypothetical protein
VQYSETFDEFPPQDVQIWLPNPAPAFDGHAIMTGSDPLTLAVYTAPPAHPFAPYLPIDGAQFAVSQDTGFTTSFAFDTSLTDFGGYFGTGIIGQPTEIHTDFTVTYLDANNHIVGTATELPTTSALTWFGWHSDTPFTTVEVSAPAGFYLMDSLQVQAVPEPSTVMLLLVPFAFSGLRAIRKK